MSRTLRRLLRPAVAATAAIAVLTGCSTGSPASDPAPPPPLRSEVTEVRVTGTEDLTDGTRRVHGVLTGAVDAGEDVVGLAAQPAGGDGRIGYEAEFEVLMPAGGASAVLVDVENRGNPTTLGFLTDQPALVTAGGPPSKTTHPGEMGNGFLRTAKLAYARVQWQTGIAAGVPATAQGIGLVTVRDFGRMLRAGRPELATAGVEPFRTTVLSGLSQSSWAATSFLAEGFNADPATRAGVFDGAFLVSAAGNWLAVNRMADDGQPQQPYVRPNGVPMTYAAMLRRPDSDPVVVDVVKYTDYFRLRASVSLTEPIPDRVRRYDLPAAHAPESAVPPGYAFDKLGCNGGTPVPLNPIDDRPYLRGLLTGLLTDLDEKSFGTALPPSAVFELEPGPATGPLVNPLPGTEVRVPRVDQHQNPVGGVRLAEVEHAVARAEPPVLTPVSTADIAAICGNFGGWAPIPTAQLQEQYRDAAGYQAAVDPTVQRLADDGFLLPTEVQAVRTTVAGAYPAR
ncbi:alpha/beta hydrolase domain-containing protein [Pseudonocardia sp.]|uniref:alpha/beta hydrolase domain-containing protein n=1 Tax=Pseudonocardia sp. TaxID=60912 RepID=UPI003D0E94FE